MSADAPTGFAAEQGLASCHTCGRLSPVASGRCPRCDTPLHLRKPESLTRTWALLAAAVLFYIPAMGLPVMRVSGLGGGEDSTIMSGVITFWQMGSYPVAIIIFTASVLIPILKILALIWLCLAAGGKLGGSSRALATTYHITELVGRWSMVDVFVVAILACLVRLGSLMTITPGPAALSFAAVVILTMFSAMSFDPRLLWDQRRRMTTPAP
ncbi:paraquat-inducible protein A [Haloferula rosea]|uniref:Paraquat-inducible protein A n=1 Tax=Haloferula rosea TaxID=490093 RepID=A0A934RB93_9BACT|nr:paraquat-inducible protein A [Haloferula rosea]MBK1826437.1 paraquat-inducible protein A [Haloferula rosea]